MLQSPGAAVVPWVGDGLQKPALGQKGPWALWAGGAASQLHTPVKTDRFVHFQCMQFVAHNLYSLALTYGEGNGNTLQCSCLENPRDGGDWWAAIYGAAQSRTRLNRLSSSIDSKEENWKSRDELNFPALRGLFFSACWLTCPEHGREPGLLLNQRCFTSSNPRFVNPQSKYFYRPFWTLLHSPIILGLLKLK